MTKTIEKETENGIQVGVNSKDSIEEYLIRTYGKEKMCRVQQESFNGGSSFTHLDVVGYTLDKVGYEIESGLNGNGFGDEYGYKDYYELDEIENMMTEKWEDKSEEDEEWDEEYVGSEDQS